MTAQTHHEMPRAAELAANERLIDALPKHTCIGSAGPCRACDRHSAYWSGTPVIQLDLIDGVAGMRADVARLRSIS